MKKKQTKKGGKNPFRAMCKKLASENEELRKQIENLKQELSYYTSDPIYASIDNLDIMPSIRVTDANPVYNTELPRSMRKSANELGYGVSTKKDLINPSSNMKNRRSARNLNYGNLTKYRNTKKNNRVPQPPPRSRSTTPNSGYEEPILRRRSKYI